MSDEILNGNEQQTNQDNGSNENVYSNDYTSNPYGYENNNASVNTDNNYYSEAPAQAEGAEKGTAIASLVLGILAILSSCCITYLGIALGIAGIVCSVLSLKKKKNGMAIAGLVCSIIAMLISVAGIIFSLYMLKSGAYDELLGALMQ